MRARFAKKMHQEDTKANWISVKVTGFGKALRMDLEDVLVRADVRYHMMHRTWFSQLGQRLACKADMMGSQSTWAKPAP